MQTKLRTYSITPNNNISFPIGTILAVEKLYDALHFSPVFSKYKKKGLDINSLLKALISYKLTDNFSIDRAHDWINREEVLELFDLKQFNERALYRTLQTLGNNREEIISDIQDILFQVYDFPHTDVNMDWTSIVLHGDKAPLGKYGTVVTIDLTKNKSRLVSVNFHIQSIYQLDSQSNRVMLMIKNTSRKHIIKSKKGSGRTHLLFLIKAQTVSEIQRLFEQIRCNI